MRALAATCVYLASVFISAAILAPWLYWGVQSVAQTVRAFSGWDDHPFHRYVNRALLILALAGLPLFLRALNIRQKNDLGLSDGNWRRRLYFGLSLSSLAVLLLYSIALAVGALSTDLSHEPARWVKHFRNALGAALFAGFLEELLFRGALFGSLRRELSFWSAALISAGAYAIVHFFARPANPVQIEWFSGFSILGQMLGGFVDVSTFLPGFINLTLLGVVFALAYEQTRSVYLSFGLHAGFIFCLKTAVFFTNPTAGANASLWGGAKGYDSWLVLIVLAILWVVLYRQGPTPTSNDFPPTKKL